jgi:hypothetical protein
MPSRNIITLLGLIQIGLIFGIIVATPISLKLFGVVSESMSPLEPPLPLILQFSRDFGISFLLLPIIWVLLASATSSRDLPTVKGVSIIGLLGGAIILGLFFALMIIVVSPFVPHPRTLIMTILTSNQVMQPTSPAAMG